MTAKRSKEQTKILTALTSTLKLQLLDSAFTTWCDYHLDLFDSIFLWLDDLGDIDSPFIPKNDRLVVQLGSQSQKLSRHGTMMQRQDENAARALELCTEKGITWLCHLDSDELLFVPSRRLLLKLWESDLGCVVFPNHEVCPVWEASNPFRECHCFKLNGRCGFNFYANGKSAVRCGPGVQVSDAHGFNGYSGKRALCWTTPILHYSCATFDWWLRKYANLGSFPNYFWDDSRHPINVPFHTASRDIYQRCLSDGDLSRAREFFIRHVIDDNERQRLLEQGKIGRFAPFGD